MSYIVAFKARFPEFDPLVVDERLPILYPSYTNIYPKPYGVNTSWDQKILLLLAHALWVDQLDSQQQITVFSSSGADGVSGGYGIPQNITSLRSYLTTSKYGGEYLTYAASRIGAVFV